MNHDKFITVLTFTQPSELYVIRARLESEGIESLVLNELSSQLRPFFSDAVGGIKLQVKEVDLDKTVEILKEAGYI
jgi:hypothetical protein